MKSFTVVTYNVGHLYFWRIWRHLSPFANKVFFQKKDAPWLCDRIKRLNPDIVFLQELTSQEEADHLKNLLGFSYAVFSPVAHYSGLGAAIIHNFPDAIPVHHPLSDFHSVQVGKYIFTNIHLEHINPHARNKTIRSLISFIEKEKTAIHIVGGDFNFRRLFGRWLSGIDKSTYNLLGNVLRDISQAIFHTHWMGYKFDYFFVDFGIQVEKVERIADTKHSIDHLPMAAHLLFKEQDLPKA